MPSTAAQLPTSPAPGQLAVLTGAGPDPVLFTYDDADHVWASDPWAAVRGYDQSGPGLENTDLTVKQYLPLLNDPVLAWDYVAHGDLAAMYAAGFELEARQSGWLAGNGTQLHVGVYFYDYLDGDFNTPSGANDPAHQYTTPPTGGWGETTYITSPSVALTDRQFASSGWEKVALIAEPPAKPYMYPAVYGFMDAGALATGRVTDYTLELRWVFRIAQPSPPPTDWTAMAPLTDADWTPIPLGANITPLGAPFYDLACAIVGPFLIFRGGVQGAGIIQNGSVGTLPAAIGGVSILPATGKIWRLTPDSQGGGAEINVTDTGDLHIVGGTGFLVFDQIQVALQG